MEKSCGPINLAQTAMLADIMRANPWTALDVDSPPFLLPQDADAVLAANARATQIGKFASQGFQLQCRPDPYTGNVLAPVVILTLNPGYTGPKKVDDKSCDDWWHANSSELREAYRKNFTQQSMRYPMFFLDPRFKGNAGHKYWTKAFKDLIDLCDLRKVANNVLVVEYFPYHSYESGGVVPVESQKFTKLLVSKAVERRATILVWRKESDFLNDIPALHSVEYLTVRNPRTPYLSSGNVNEWSRLVSAVKQGEEGRGGW